VRRPFISLLITLVTLPLLAQSGTWGSRGISRKFALDGNRLFAAEGRGVAVYDVSDPTSPKRLETATRDDETLDVAVMSSARVVSITTAGIDLWSIGLDGRLTLIATRAQRGLTAVAASATTIAVATASKVLFFDDTLTSSGAMDIAARVNAMILQRQTFFIAIDGIGVAIVDANNPANASIVPEPAKDLAFGLDTLWLAGGARGLIAVDPDSLRIISSTDAGEVNFTRLAVSGSRVTVVDNDSMIREYDASNLEAPRLIGSFAAAPRAMAAFGGTLFLDGGDATPLRAYANDKVIGSFAARSVPVSGVAISPNGSLAYIVDAPFLRVIDVSNSAAPREIGSLRIDGIEDHIHVNGDGTRAVLYNRGDVQMVDLRNPYTPKLLGIWHSYGRSPSRAAFLRDHVIEANWMTGFHVLDIDHYAEPQIIGSLKFDYWDLEARPDSDVAYVNSEVSVIAAMNAQDATRPFVSHMVPAYMIEGTFADANDQHAPLLIARTPGSIRILDLADELAPADVVTIPMSDAASITASGETAYIATSGIITLMDVTNAAQPSFNPSAMRVTAPLQMAAVGQKLVIADTYSLRVYGPNTAPVPLPQPSRRRPSRP
jgi:hypothetical protein